MPKYVTSVGAVDNHPDRGSNDECGREGYAKGGEIGPSVMRRRTYTGQRIGQRQEKHLADCEDEDCSEGKSKRSAKWKEAQSSSCEESTDGKSFPLIAGLDSLQQDHLRKDNQDRVASKEKADVVFCQSVVLNNVDTKC